MAAVAAQLVVFGFDSPDQARRAWSLGRRLRRRKRLDLADGALVGRDHDGRVTVRHLASPGCTAALGGAVCGGVAGAVFLAPILGLGLGAGAGALAGRLRRSGIDEAMVRRIAGHLRPGRAAVIVLVRGSVDDVTAALRPHQPVVLMTTLPAERERRLARLLSQRPAPA
ncbi:DUF1269 domain-containing protein [Frankia sp. AgKG'84/4]|uniref:DUF1269 domain-containing protein n=1 Tax=Frankia sp. AgKG'84/4 TaxID=573490 RepID=UPI00200E5466|nr:DUF1269 domain-containing protein [Frankia sp. AgKG'84/4]MCL9796272.1 DUF1269 domain-containing protein [Frankia sp. AgKG'84/4]